MNNKKKPLQRRVTPRRRPPTSNYYRSGASAPASSDSPFKAKVKSSPRLKKFLSRLVDIILVVALLIGLIYSLIVNPKPKIEVNNTFYHSAENYRDSTRDHLGALKDRNKISFDEKGLINALMLDYPEIDSVSVELPVFAQQPVVHIKIGGPAFVLASGGHSYVIDSSGKAIGLISNFNKAGSLPKVIDDSGYEVVVGKAVLSSPDVAFTKSVIAQSSKAGIKLDSLVLPSTPAELDVKPSGRPYVVKFFLPGDATIQIGQFLASVHQFDSSGNGPSEYLDVRVSGKIFYK